jgi:hypothetical protein
LSSKPPAEEPESAIEPLAEPSLDPSLLTPLDELAEALLDPLLADDDAPTAPELKSPALPGYCANDIDGAKTMPPNPANATMAPRTQITGRLLKQTITNLCYFNHTSHASHISNHNTAAGLSQ